jgi:hypothetical protein
MLTHAEWTSLALASDFRRRSGPVLYYAIRRIAEGAMLCRSVPE